MRLSRETQRFCDCVPAYAEEPMAARVVAAAATTSGSPVHQQTPCEGPHNLMIQTIRRDSGEEQMHLFGIKTVVCCPCVRVSRVCACCVLRVAFLTVLRKRAKVCIQACAHLQLGTLHCFNFVCCWATSLGRKKPPSTRALLKENNKAQDPCARKHTFWCLSTAVQ